MLSDSPRTLESNKPGSRIPYLDGLRAISITFVLLAHANERDHWLGSHTWLASLCADGDLGVRIFFVISGFLITTLLLQEIDRNGRISIRKFYERRIARIFPAYYLYITIAAVLTAVGLLNVPRALFLTTAVFAWNINFAVVHFFPHPIPLGGPNDGLLLGHFWSLTIEEQFYLIWPSLLAFLGLRWSRRLAFAGLILLPALRFVVFHRVPYSYAGLRETVLQRSMQDLICIGSLAAFAVRDGLLSRFANLRIRPAIPWIAAITIFGLCPWLASLPRLDLADILVPTIQGIAIVLLIFWLLAGQRGGLRSFLELRPIVHLGLISYSLYIWQQVFTLSSRLSWLHFPLEVLVPIPVAMLSYHFFEMPMRTRIRGWFHQAPAPHA